MIANPKVHAVIPSLKLSNRVIAILGSNSTKRDNKIVHYVTKRRKASFYH